MKLTFRASSTIILTSQMRSCFLRMLLQMPANRISKRRRHRLSPWMPAKPFRSSSNQGPGHSFFSKRCMLVAPPRGCSLCSAVYSYAIFGAGFTEIMSMVLKAIFPGQHACNIDVVGLCVRTAYGRSASSSWPRRQPRMLSISLPSS